MNEQIQKMFTDGSWVNSLIPLGQNILIAILIYYIGGMIAKQIVRLIERVMNMRQVDEALKGFALAIISTLLKVVIILAALDALGIPTTSLLAVLGAAGLAVGLALKDSLSNFAAGVMLIIFKPFKIGDFIEAGGVAAVVEKITVFNTVMRSGDNKEIIVPNSQIYGGTIVNYSAKSTRRVDLVIGIGYDDDIRKARDLIMQVINADERILQDPAPVVALNELGDSSLNFVVRPWVNAADYWAVKWSLLEHVKYTFDEHGISIPYPQQDVHMHNAA
ncbi:MAG: mechanosensitive ion channel [Cellvibrionaceae bacterium]|nr:mechanosensitive ion channel [Cellvibrionaceae bacterium]